MNSSTLRLLGSAAVAFVFYFAWAYWANSRVTDESALLMRAALVQGALSASITLVFTLLVEKSVAQLGDNCYSLMFVVPILCKVHANTRQNLAIMRSFNHALDLSAGYFKGACLAGGLLAPLPALLLQSSLVIGVNWLNTTPNLWLTVAPSILLSALYGYSYTFTLLKLRRAQG